MVLISIVTLMQLRRNYRWMMCVLSVGKPWQRLPRSCRVITFSTPHAWGHGFRDSRLVLPVGETYWGWHPPHHKPHPLNPHNPLRHNPHKTVCQRILFYFFNFLRNSNFWNTRYKWFVFFNLILVFGGMAGMPPQMWPQPPVQPHQPNVAQPGWLRFVFSIRKTKKFIQCM